MDKKKLNLIIAGLIILVGGFLAMNMMGPKPEPMPPQGGQVPAQSARPQAPQYSQAVFAKRDIPKGSLITEDMVKAKRIPAHTQGADDILYDSHVIGKVATVNIVIGEKITKGRVQVKPSEMKLAMKVPDGKRAVTIPIDKLASLEGMIKPGDNVDIVGTFPFQNQQPVVVPMFENVLILAVGRTMTEYAAQGGYGTITMALTQKESTLLLYSTQLGKLNLLLRSPLDSKKSQVKEAITMDKLWATLFNVSQQQQSEMQQQQQGAALQQQQGPASSQSSVPKPNEDEEIEVFVAGQRGR